MIASFGHQTPDHIQSICPREERHFGLMRKLRRKRRLIVASHVGWIRNDEVESLGSDRLKEVTRQKANPLSHVQMIGIFRRNL